MWYSRLQAAVFEGLRESRPALITGAIIWLTAILVLALKGVNALEEGGYLANLVIYAFTALFFLVPLGAVALYRQRPEHPIAFLAQRATQESALRRVGRGLPLLIAQVMFMPAFSALKSSVPLFQAYSWDITFIALDRAIHGTDPWRLLQPVLGRPWITSFLSLGYHVWLMLIYAGGIWFCFCVRDPVLRNRYFIGYFAIWAIIGGAMAIAMASVGPCFLEPLLGDPYYAEQMAYLYRANETAPILVLPVQEQLLAWQQAHSHGLGAGITAMPSMHVAMATLTAFTVRQISHTAGWVFFGYVVFITVSSVHLGYHYAVDGYVSIIVTSLIWSASGILARRSTPAGNATDDWRTPMSAH